MRRFPWRKPISIATANGSIRPVWLLVPVVLIVGSMLALLGWLWLRGWIRSTRANRAYLKS